MPSIDSVVSDGPVKLMIVGNSGAGKTGLLGSLAKNYRLFIFDFDNGTEILKDPAVLDPKYRSNVFVKSFYDKHEMLGGQLLPKIQGYTDFVRELSSWSENGKSLGGVHSWGDKDIAVIDSLTFLGECCMKETLKINRHVGQRPTQPDWGDAIDRQESVIEMLYNPAVKCHVIVTAHLMADADELVGGTKLFPSALGRKLPKKIQRYFNNVVLIQKTGAGTAVKRELHTVATFNADLKVSRPSKIPAIMPPDLGALFELLRAA